jgi:tetratricopeptide (TPR) repeat protein
VSDFLDELERLEVALGDDASGAAAGVFHRYQHATLTGNREHLARAEARLHELTQSIGPRSDLCLLQAHIDLTLHRFDAARQVLERCPELAESSFGHALAGDLELQSGNFAAASTSYEAALAEDPGWDNLARLAHLHAVLGNAAKADELYVQAEDELTAKQMRAFAWLELQRGQLAFRRGELGCAEERYERANRAYSGYWLVDDCRAELLAANARWQAARSLYEEVVARVDRPELWHALGDVTAAGGDPRRAQTYHERALAGYTRSVRQGDQHYVHHLAHFYLDVCHDVGEALRYAHRDVELRRNPWTMSLLAWSTYMAGRPAEALDLVSDASASGIVEAELFRQWATIYQANHRVAEAEHFAARATQLNPHLDAFHVDR